MPGAMLILFDLAAIAFFVAVMLTPLVRDWAKRFGFVDRPDHVRKVHEQPVPRVGGIAIALSYVLAFAAIFFAPYRNLQIDLHEAIPRSLMLIGPASIVFLTGLLDDFFGLRPWQKLIGQLG